jgi:hypothetical protein
MRKALRQALARYQATKPLIQYEQHWQQLQKDQPKDPADDSCIVCKPDLWHLAHHEWQYAS